LFGFAHFKEGIFFLGFRRVDLDMKVSFVVFLRELELMEVHSEAIQKLLLSSQHRGKPPILRLFLYQAEGIVTGLELKL
jgi:hypothetical protein